jgi:Ca2+-binding RTX toxin-like protein
MATRIGTDRSETLRGTNGSDTLDGRGGNDTLLGLGGNDLLINGPGEDRFDGGAGQDSLRLHQQSQAYFRGGSLPGFVGDSLDDDSVDEVDSFTGIETVLGSEQSDIISGDGGTARLRLFGAGGDDEVNGGAGGEELGGGTGDDDLSGGAGDDLVKGGDGNDEVDGGDGNDQLAGGTGDDFLEGGTGNDVVRGGLGNDYILDRSGNNRLLGGDGDDTLFGGDGADILEGGRGRDFLRDDEGTNDTYLLGADAPDEAFFSYQTFADDGNVSSLGADRVLGFASGPAHLLDINLFGVLLEDGREAFVDTRDFLDSNDDGRINAADAEVARVGNDLVLDIGAVLDRALGDADYGVQRITLAGAGDGFAATRVEELPEPSTTYNRPIVREDTILEPPITGPDADAIA